MSRRSFRFSYLLGTVLVFFCRCVTSPGEDNGEPLQCRVVDVGQGLAQLAERSAAAVAIDLGPGEAHDSWRAAYTSLGSPEIEAVVISHTHDDHYGGLGLLDVNLSFSGLVVMPAGSDTALVRATAGAWKERLQFRCVSAGDTLGFLPGVHIEVLWPPKGSLTPGAVYEEVNRYSLCLHITYQATSLICTGDIDSVALMRLATEHQRGLRADILVVPHHGSVSGLNTLFYGYVSPQVAVISCSRPPNEFGHPSPRVMDLLFQMETAVHSTFENGMFRAASNGEYFVW